MIFYFYIIVRKRLSFHPEPFALSSVLLTFGAGVGRRGAGAPGTHSSRLLDNVSPTFVGTAHLGSFSLSCPTATGPESRDHLKLLHSYKTPQPRS